MNTFPTIVSGHWVIGWPVCVVTGFLLFWSGLLRTYLLAVLSIDRFLNIYAPFAYPHVQKMVINSMSLFSWLTAAAASIIPLPGILDCYGLRPIQTQCYIAASCLQRCRIYIFVFWTFIASPACIVPVIMYSLLCYKVQKIK